MYNPNENAVMEYKPFTLPAMIEGDFSTEELAEDMEGLQSTYPRIKIPGGGVQQFELPSGDPENPDYVRFLEGVVVFNHSHYAYWPEGSEYDENTSPLCSSVDGKQGIGEPGGACATCELNKFGSAPDGKGKACKNMRALYLLQDGGAMPSMLSLPPTSIKPWTEFINAAFLARGRGICGSIIQIGLKKASNGSNEYSVATFRKVRDFTGPELAQIKAYSESFKKQVKGLQQLRAAATEDRFDDGCDYKGYDQAAGEDGAYCVPGHIDGEREQLPA